MSEPFILCDGLVKIYKIAGLEQVALRELNLSIEKGELMAIVGASGSGKTTLMNILGGLDRPSAGRVRVDGQDLLRMSDSQLNRYRRERVGFVWQQSTRNLIPYLNAIDNVILPMTVAGRMRHGKRRASELLELVGLSNRKHHRLSELSGVHLARYSPRPGTVSERRMVDDVPEEEKMRRHKVLETLQEQVSTEINQRFLGEIVEVLVEDQHKGKWRGRNRQNKLVFIESDLPLRGRLVEAQITWTGPWSMQGRFVRDVSPRADRVTTPRQTLSLTLTD